jgi:DNA-binding NtrC family response regulator
VGKLTTAFGRKEEMIMAEHAKVLVVDDDTVIGQSFDRVLTEKGYEVNTALSGEEALRKMGTEGYDLVFTDIKMPGMDGLEVAKRVKEMNPWIPVVVVTGYGTEANEARAEEIGVSGFLHKPLSPEVIEGITKKTLKEHPAPETSEEPVTATEAAAEEKENVAKNIALFFAAPFIGLAYIIAFPFVGVYALVRWGLKAMTAGNRPSENQS